ncbi:hypothetical protein PPERSA_09688 [Pseudocohnilembus persalinus]|uniref:Uncharacterized protein n=1 Tax=Pseudocohnilembus persalinus TaxID=266149 RepID=A0A0V0R7H2_PSEPJ|nr:hypothetical protein PPERSA_09688 [Pseudocohnilembus persalinus]|eukprot:KRX10304.1 hypothetical protein PPERSA_09688 [Pseudocohnilembus persalinus]
MINLQDKQFQNRRKFNQFVRYKQPNEQEELENLQNEIQFQQYRNIQHDFPFYITTNDTNLQQNQKKQLRHKIDLKAYQQEIIGAPSGVNYRNFNFDKQIESRISVKVNNFAQVLHFGNSIVLQNQQEYIEDKQQEQVFQEEIKQKMKKIFDHNTTQEKKMQEQKEKDLRELEQKQPYKKVNKLMPEEDPSIYYNLNNCFDVCNYLKSGSNIPQYYYQK